jgi:hypothetical protein
MPQVVSLEFASPDTWGALPTFDPRAIYSLQHEVKTEGKLKFADDYHRRLVSTEGD